jgi:hypothetical protein
MGWLQIIRVILNGLQTYMEGFEGPRSAVHEVLGGYITFSRINTWRGSDSNGLIVIWEATALQMPPERASRTNQAPRSLLMSQFSGCILL